MLKVSKVKVSITFSGVEMVGGGVGAREGGIYFRLECIQYTAAG